MAVCMFIIDRLVTRLQAEQCLLFCDPKVLRSRNKRRITLASTIVSLCLLHTDRSGSKVDESESSIAEVDRLECVIAKAYRSS